MYVFFVISASSVLFILFAKKVQHAIMLDVRVSLDNQHKALGKSRVSVCLTSPEPPCPDSHVAPSILLRVLLFVTSVPL